MKKYIAPSAKRIDVQSENLMAMSGGLNNQEGQAGQFSNKRGASDAIWGTNDEDGAGY